MTNEEANRARKRAQDKIERAYSDVFDQDITAVGLVLNDLKHMCFYNRSFYDTEAREMDLAHAEGRRWVILRILKMSQTRGEQDE